MREVPLGEVANFASGGTPPRRGASFYRGEIPWITGADIDPSGTVRARSFINHAAIADSAARVVPAGTVLLVTRTSVGKVGITAVPTSYSQDITAVLHDGDRLDRQYLVHYLRSREVHLASQARGATIKGVTREDVADLMVPLPPVDEQRRIAAILDHVEAVRAKRRQALDLLGALPQSVFLEMFGSTTSEVCSVEEVALAKRGAIRTGPFGSQLLHSEFVPEGVAVLGLDNVVRNQFRWEQRRYITEQKYEQLKRYTVFPGDVLISIMGTCGRCVVVPDDVPTAINTKHICAVTVDRSRVLPEYLRACFLWHSDSRRYLSGRAKGAIMDGLNMASSRRCRFPFLRLISNASSRAGFARLS